MLLSVQEFVLTRVNELRPFRTKVDLPEGVRLDLSRFTRSHTTHYNRLCNKVNLLLRDVILVPGGGDFRNFWVGMWR